MKPQKEVIISANPVGAWEVGSVNPSSDLDPSVEGTIVVAKKICCRHHNSSCYYEVILLFVGMIHLAPKHGYD
jgi:hypothetical protein